MSFEVLIADDAAMPEGNDWLLIEHTEGALVVIRRRAVGLPRTAHETWAAYCALVERRRRRPALPAAG